MTKNSFFKFFFTFKYFKEIIYGGFVLIIFLSLFSLTVNDFNLLKFLILFISFFSVFVFLMLVLWEKKNKSQEESLIYSLTFKLLEHLQEGIVIYDDNLKIIYCNQYFSDLVGLSKNDLLNLTVKSEMINNLRYKILANIFFPFLKGEDIKIINQEPEVIKVKFSEPEEKYLLISYFQIKLEKPYKLRIVLDKTEDFLEAERKIEFVQLIGHSLLTPLSEIRWNLEALDTNSIKDEDLSLIENAKKTVKTAIVLSESILTFLQAEYGQIKFVLEKVDLESLIVEILDLLRSKIEEKKIKIQVEIEETSRIISVDKKVILISLFTLLENAVLYNKENGLVEIKISKIPKRPYVEFMIKDTGIGMNEQDLANIFKKYYRSKKTKDLNISGFGIGLYKVKKILDIYGAKIKVDSKENEGTTFYLYFPIETIS
jgi:signal transduction histidine kinase